MNALEQAGPSAAAERAARCGAGLLLAIALACLLTAADPDQPAVRRAPLRIDPDTATRAELMLLPDIGPARADAILAQRDGEGRGLASERDLDRVRGIGPRRLEKLRPHLLFDTPADETP